jgi:hypothetical protein
MRDNDVNSLLPSETPIELLSSAGEPVEHDLAMPDRETLVEAYRKMVIARRWEAQVTALTRQGRLATYPSAYGQEAGEVGSVLGLADNDWLFPTYRESSALLTRGMHPSPTTRTSGTPRRSRHRSRPRRSTPSASRTASGCRAATPSRSRTSATARRARATRTRR